MYDDDDNFDDEMGFNEYTIDDTLDSLTKLEKYYESEFSLQRLVLVRELNDTVKEAGISESNRRIVPLLSNFVSDSESAVRQVFAEQLYNLAMYFLNNSKEGKGYNQLINTFIPYAFELIVDKNSGVSTAATEALLKLAPLVKPDDLIGKLFKIISNLSQDERVEEFRMTAAMLFNNLAHVFGPKICAKMILPEVLLLGDDSAFKVRKTVASNLENLCKTIGIDFTEKHIFGIYNELCKDEVWGVRKECAKSLASISKCVSPALRNSKLVTIFEIFLDDVSRWVKIEAYKQLGPFIATFQKVPSILIKYFIGMAHQKNQNDSDLIEYCAFNFPAVVMTLGADEWKTLEKSYITLVKEVQWKVRRSLAFSLHEIAHILGTNETEKSLLQPFDLFLKDLDEVKLGVITNLSKFYKVLTNKIRAKYLKLICELPDETDNWRIRKEIALQIPGLVELLPSSLIEEYILKLANNLFEDHYASVRKTALSTCGIILKNLCEKDQKDQEELKGKQKLISYLQVLGKGNSLQRQMFLFAAEGLITNLDKSLFTIEFLPILLHLSTDPVPNVRLSLSAFLSKVVLVNKAWKNDKTLISLITLLSKDKDEDVKFSLEGILKEVNKDKKKENKEEKQIEKKIEEKKQEKGQMKAEKTEELKKEEQKKQEEKKEDLKEEKKEDEKKEEEKKEAEKKEDPKEEEKKEEKKEEAKDEKKEPNQIGE